MTYICKDRGSEKCPCILLEAGQCYTCGMIGGSKCDCLPEWQGVCPLNEYAQDGYKIAHKDESKSYKIIESVSYSEELKVIVLEVPPGYALKCKELGAFLMIEAEGHNVPISVMKSEIKGGKGYVYLAFYAAGPKTLALGRNCDEGNLLFASGPFNNGLINSEDFQYGKPSAVIAKGIAVMPLLNQKERICSNMKAFYLDTQKLPKSFLQDYLADIKYEEVNLNENFHEAARQFANTCRNYWYANVLMLLSPYYVNEFMEEEAFSERRVIYPNHSNMCCGEGICGACSFTNSEGVTVRRCKCNNA